MSSLKALKIQIAGVKSTRKITEAMRLVAASKLYRAQIAMSGAKAYIEKMNALMKAGASSSVEVFDLPLFSGGKGNKTLVLVMTGNRGLAGAYNVNVTRHLRTELEKLKEQGEEPVFYIVGKKAHEILKRNYASSIVKTEMAAETREEQEKQAADLASFIVEKVDEGEYSRVILLHNRFVNAMVQVSETVSLVPPVAEETEETQAESDAEDRVAGQFEPSQEEWLKVFLPVNLKVRIYHALLENEVGVQGARMVAMDGASRNANKMIDSLSLQYNRMRQSNITKELSEIVAGATAVGDK